VVNSLSGSTSSVVNSLSGSTSSALDQNQLYSDQNQVFGTAAQFEVLGNLGGAFLSIGDGGVSVTGGVVGADNTAYAGNVITGALTPAFGIEYTGSTLYGYSPDPDFIQSTIINATLDGALATGGDLTTWSLLGGNGNDSIIGGDNADTIYGDADSRPGGDDNDTIIGGAGADVIVGNDGDDSILGGDGQNTIGGGSGADTIVGGNDGNFIQGGLGDNSLLGGSGNDTIYGGEENVPAISGNDTIVGSSGNDSLFGQDGTDLFKFANEDFGSASTIVGGAGQDTLAFTNAATVLDTQFANKSSIEVVTTFDGVNSSLTFGTNANSLGLDSVVGGTGNDTFVLGNTFTDTGVTLRGGNGADSISVNDYTQITSGFIDGGGTGADVDRLQIRTSLGSTTGPTYSSINTNNVVNIEELQLGSTAANYVILDGSAGWGIPTVSGGADVQNFISTNNLNASVTLNGNNLSDNITGGNFADQLQGYTGPVGANTSNDTLSGGGAADTFVLGDATGNAYRLNNTNSPVAYINGFDEGIDILRLSGNLGANAGAYTVGQVGTTSVFTVTDNFAARGIVAYVDVQTGNGSDILNNASWIN